MSFGFSHISFTTGSSSLVFVTATYAGVASQTVAILASVIVVIGKSIGTYLELHGTTFFICDNMLSVFSSIKMVPRRVLTASLSTMWTAACFKESPMQF